MFAESCRLFSFVQNPNRLYRSTTVPLDDLGRFLSMRRSARKLCLCFTAYRYYGYDTSFFEQRRNFTRKEEKSKEKLTKGAKDARIKKRRNSDREKGEESCRLFSTQRHNAICCLSVNLSRLAKKKEPVGLDDSEIQGIVVKEAEKEGKRTSVCDISRKRAQRRTGGARVKAIKKLRSRGLPFRKNRRLGEKGAARRALLFERRSIVLGWTKEERTPNEERKEKTIDQDNGRSATLRYTVVSSSSSSRRIQSRRARGYDFRLNLESEFTFFRGLRC